jgi:phospholipid/cholesterol/gamma-HCH transport system substrate-binding protein
MEVVLGRVERGEGTLDKLASDDSLYTNANNALSTLNATLFDVRLLARDLREHPERYVHINVF